MTHTEIEEKKETEDKSGAENQNCDAELHDKISKGIEKMIPKESTPEEDVMNVSISDYQIAFRLLKKENVIYDNEINSLAENNEIDEKVLKRCLKRLIRSNYAEYYIKLPKVNLLKRNRQKDIVRGFKITKYGIIKYNCFH